MPNVNRRQWLALTGALSAAALSACGFRLRGTGLTYPFRSIYIAGSGLMVDQLKRLLASQVQVLDTPAEADVRLTVLSDHEERSASALSASAKVREVELKRDFDFSLSDANGNMLIESAPIQMRRFVSYSENEATAKEAELELLFHAMRNDTAQQVLRRLAVIRPAAAAP